MLTLSIIATVLLSINILFTLAGMLSRHELNTAVFSDIFALVVIWVLYSH